MNISNIILTERKTKKFKDFLDFVKRTYTKGINRKMLESLILSGVFRNFKYNKKTLIMNLDNIINYADLASDNTLIEIEEPIIDAVEEYTKDELIKQEFDIFGFYISNHPVSKYKRENTITTLNLKENDNKYINIVLEIQNIKEIITKTDDVMAFIRACDEFKQIDITVFPKLYEENKNLNKHDIILVQAKVEKRLDNYQLLANKIIKLNEE